MVEFGTMIEFWEGEGGGRSNAHKLIELFLCATGVKFVAIG